MRRLCSDAHPSLRLQDLPWPLAARHIPSHSEPITCRVLALVAILIFVSSRALTLTQCMLARRPRKRDPVSARCRCKPHFYFRFRIGCLF